MSFRKVGEFLNYPDCCITAFENWEHMDKKDYPSHDGFVPCEAHKDWTREELEELVGRKFSMEPENFKEFLDTIW